MVNELLLYTSMMFDLKLLAVACAAFFFVWKVFSKKKQQDDEQEEEEDLFKSRPHDVILTPIKPGGATAAGTAKLRASYTQSVVTIGRMNFNMLPLSSPLISSEHAIVKWNADQNCWHVKDVGSMNGTRLNEVVISTDNRRPSDEFPLRHGDVITLAEDIELHVSLATPEKMPGAGLRSDLSRLRVAPRTGLVNAQLPTRNSGLSTARERTSVPSLMPKTEQEEFYAQSIDAEFAVVTQVGMEHWRNGSPSEDVVFWQLPFANFLRSAIFGVCDGHLGTEASKAIPRLFPTVLSGRINDSSKSLFASTSCENILHSTFLDVDSKLDTDAGSTTTILLAERGDHEEVYIQAANVGDSFGILINTNTGQFTSLTADHRVANQEERKRLQQLGNALAPSSTRHYMLNLARAMGDTNLKKINTALIATPYVSPVIRITPNKAHLIVIASDGLWDCVTRKEVTDLAVQEVQKWEGLRAFGNALIKLAAQERGAKDDISVFLTRL